MNSKQCRGCDQIKPLLDFYKAKTSKDRRQSTCKECDKKANAIWQKINADKCRVKNAAWRYKTKYRGPVISPEERDRLFTVQSGKCAICGIAEGECSRKLAVDHDHITNEIRGLLCMLCNRGLGLFKDSESRLTQAAEYIRKNTKPI